MSVTTDIKSWLDLMPRDQIEAAIKQRQAEIRQYEQALQLHARIGLEPRTQHSSQNGGAKKPSLRQAVLTVLETAQPGKRWPLREIRKGLVQRDLLRADERGRHDLQNMMLKMVRKGEVVRPKTGVYVLPKAGRATATS
jgi:hypothetical protein